MTQTPLNEVKNGTRPGLAIFSREWFDEVATDVEEPFREAVREICEQFSLGNSRDPNLVFGILRDKIREELLKKHRVDDGTYKVIAVGMDEAGAFYIGECLDEEDSGYEHWYGSDDIESLA